MARTPRAEDAIATSTLPADVETAPLTEPTGSTLAAEEATILTATEPDLSRSEDAEIADPLPPTEAVRHCNLRDYGDEPRSNG